MVTRIIPGIHAHLRAPEPQARFRRLQAQRGAAVFIVVMVLTLLTAVGIFAVRSSSLADLASGYDREAAQASLVAEYATVATASYLATAAGSTVITNLTPSLFCQSNSNVGKISLPCFKMMSQQIEASTLLAGNENLFETSSPSLNVNGKTDADFLIELTDPGGSGDLGHGDPRAPAQVTATAIAQVRQAGVCVNGVGVTWNAGQQVTRSFISAGSLSP
jgi:hypothetical protein